MGVDETRERLLNAAGEVFAEKGFKSATVRDICAAAGGANVAAVHYHFRDKEQLYIAAVARAHCSGQDQGPPQWPEGTAAEDKLRGFIHQMLHQLLDPNQPAWYPRLMMRELADPSAACAHLVDAYIRPKAMVLGGILRGLMPAHSSDLEVFLFAFSVVGQCLFYRVHWPIVQLLAGPTLTNAMSIDTLAAHIGRFSLAALQGVQATANTTTIAPPLPNNLLGANETNMSGSK